MENKKFRTVSVKEPAYDKLEMIRYRYKLFHWEAVDMALDMLLVKLKKKRKA